MTGMIKTMRVALCAVMFVGVLLTVASPASAQEGYGVPGTTPPNGSVLSNNVPPEVLGESLTRPATAVNPAAGSQLPFTGSDIAQLLVIALVSIAVGSVLVRRARRPLRS